MTIPHWYPMVAAYASLAIGLGVVIERAVTESLDKHTATIARQAMRAIFGVVLERGGAAEFELDGKVYRVTVTPEEPVAEERAK